MYQHHKWKFTQSERIQSGSSSLIQLIFLLGFWIDEVSINSLNTWGLSSPPSLRNLSVRKLEGRIQWLILQIISIFIFQRKLISLKNVHIFPKLKHSVRLDDLIQSLLVHFLIKKFFFSCQVEFIQPFTHSFSQLLLSICYVLGPQPVPMETQMVKSIFPYKMPMFCG